jgi:hypothetical protein
METSLSLAGQPVRRGTMAHEHDVYMLLTETAVNQREAAAIEQYAARLEPLAARDEHALYQAIAHRAWGVARRLRGDLPAAQTRLAQALAMFNSLGADWQAARTHLELAEATSDPAAARAHYTEALAAFESLSARPDADRARAALQALP